MEKNYIFVTCSVASGLGRGTTTASLGHPLFRTLIRACLEVKGA